MARPAPAAPGHPGGQGRHNADQERRGLVGQHSDRDGPPASQRLRHAHHVRRGHPAGGNRLRPRRLGRGQERGRQRGRIRRARPPDQPRGRAASDRAQSGRHHDDLGDALQRRARRFCGAVGPRHAGARPTRAERGRDQRGRHRAVGHPGQASEPAGVAASGRAQGRPAAGLCLRWLGAGRDDRRTIAQLRRSGRVSRRQDAGGRDGRRPPRLGRAREGRPPGAGSGYRDRRRRAWHLHRIGRPALCAYGGGLRSRLVRGTGQRG